MFKRTLLSALAVATFGAVSVVAQTTAAVDACFASIVNPYPKAFQYATADTTVFSETFRYNATLCTTDIKFTSSRVIRTRDGVPYTCSVPTFNGSGAFTTTCSTLTKGAMATSSTNTAQGNEWSIALQLGPAPARALYGDFTVSVAQPVTADELNACAQSIVGVGLRTTYSWRTDDATYFTPQWTYNPALCTPRITFSASRLVNNNGERFYLCVLPAFDGSGSFVSLCNKITKGEMATFAALEEPEDSWSLVTLFGAPGHANRGLYVDYSITPVDPNAPQPTGAFSKRKRDDQHVFDCPIGHTWCSTGQGQDYACMDTSSDVSACGQCPFAFGAEQSDCTSIEGVDDVECRNSRCVVQACQRGFQISLDRTKCLDGRKRSRLAAMGFVF